MKEIFEPILDEFEILSAEDLSSLEKALNCSLPEDYANFLLQYGRCMFAGEASIKLDNGRDLEVFTMFGTKSEVGNILSDIQLHPEYFDQGLIPIADDMFNNRYLINKKTGSIFFIDYDAAEASPVLVKNTFTEFINGIEVIPDEE